MGFSGFWSRVLLTVVRGSILTVAVRVREAFKVIGQAVYGIGATAGVRLGLPMNALVLVATVLFHQ